MRLAKYFFALFVMFCSAGWAGVGSTDERENVDWGDWPEIVALVKKPDYASCTAQYVAPDIILTARHCITKKADHDGYALRGTEFNFRRYDGATFPAVVEEYGYTNIGCVTGRGQCSDWALFRVTDSRFYGTAYFDVSQKGIGIAETKRVSRAGFGWMRIISDAELKKLYEIVKQYVADNDEISWKLDGAGTNGYADVIDENGDVMGLGTLIRGMNDEISRAGIAPLRQKGFYLKAHKNCNMAMMGREARTDCDSWSGDSGSAFFDSTRLLWGALFGAVDSMLDEYNTSRVVLSKDFYDVLVNMKNKDSADPIVRDDWVGGDDEDKKLELFVDDSAPKLLLKPSMLELDEMEQEINSVATDIGQGVENIDKLTRGEFLHLLDKVVSVDVLLAEYQDALARERSLVNKTVGTAAIGAMGIGGMQLASGLSERAADAAAEQDMRAYLATFRCDYGVGGAQGGDVSVQLPMANIGAIKSEYLQLATDLKLRKEALGLSAGIESDVARDAAAVGLYDDVAVGKTDGAFTSVARALMDENSDDADAWRAQREDADKKVSTGAITVGSGAAVGVVGNVINNIIKK